jgi:hypothetical protein
VNEDTVMLEVSAHPPADALDRVPPPSARVGRVFSLAGKDYFTQEEAAFYCCVSLRKFREVAPISAIHPTKFGGKLVYRRIDCVRALEREFERWQL